MKQVLTLLLGLPVTFAADITFSKAANADNHLRDNRDQITSTVSLTRADCGGVYNYDFWSQYSPPGEMPADQNDCYNENAGYSAIGSDFWGYTKTAKGGTRGVRWGILSTAGMTSTQSDAMNPDLLATLGCSENFMPYRGVAGLGKVLNNGDTPISLREEYGDGDDFLSWYVNNGEENEYHGSTNPGKFVGWDLAIMLEDKPGYYARFKFTEWGSGGSGGAVGWTRDEAKYYAIPDGCADEPHSKPITWLWFFLNLWGLW